MSYKHLLRRSNIGQSVSVGPLLHLQHCFVLVTGEPGGEKKERAANLINIGNGAVQVYLSSAAKEDPKSDDTILIGPPFYLELKLAGFTLPIQVILYLIIRILP